MVAEYQDHSSRPCYGIFQRNFSFGVGEFNLLAFAICRRFCSFTATLLVPPCDMPITSGTVGFVFLTCGFSVSLCVSFGIVAAAAAACLATLASDT